jgi:acetyl-CoA decarbonylase/synthase complex subunit delta
VASSPIDVNLAKQLNILLGNLGVPSEKIVIDPTTGGLGYGLEYSYSVMERIRMAALTQEDDKLQIPMISNIGNEVWKSKEAGQPLEEVPTLGDPERRGVLMETVASVSYLLGGADVVILRHPESVRLTRSFIDLMMNGGLATDVPEISKNLELQEADLLSISPEPKLAVAEEAVPAKEKPAEPKKKEVKAAPKPEKKEEKPKEVPKPEEKVVELKPKEKPEEEARAKAEAEAKAKAEEDAKKRAEEEARKKAEEEDWAKAEAKAKAKAEEEARKIAEAKAKEKEDLKALRYQRGLEREKLEAQRAEREREKVSKTPARAQKSWVDKLIDNLDRIHKRI